MSFPFKTPFLLYAYPWMPFPRVIGIYLKERRISPSLVTVVQVSDPQEGDQVVDTTGAYPPRPKGSLPILALPVEESSDGGEAFQYIRQTPAIVNFIEELCTTGNAGFPKSASSMMGADALHRARIQEIRTLAEECLVNWNPIRMFGSGAGSMKLPEAAKEMIPWVMRPLSAIETLLSADNHRLSRLRSHETEQVTIADIVLYQFLEFTHYCYGIDLVGSGIEDHIHKDVYGRPTNQSFEHLRTFYKAMNARPSVRRDFPGEVPPKKAFDLMHTWFDGVWNFEVGR